MHAIGNTHINIHTYIYIHMCVYAVGYGVVSCPKKPDDPGGGNAFVLCVDRKELDECSQKKHDEILKF